MNELQAVTAWISECPTVKQFYPLSGKIADNVDILTLVGSEVKKTFAHGARQVQLDFGINSYKQDKSSILSRLFKKSINDQISQHGNIMDFSESRNISAWIEEQNNLKLFPIFENGFVEKIIALPYMPEFAGTDETGLSKYVVQFRVMAVVDA